MMLRFKFFTFIYLTVLVAIVAADLGKFTHGFAGSLRILLDRSECPAPTEVKTLNPFYMEAYQGNWYVVSKLLGTFFAPSPRHYVDPYGYGSHPMTLICENTTVSLDQKDENQMIMKQTGYTDVLKKSFSFKSTVKRSGGLSGPGQLTMFMELHRDFPYWILDTDYANFAIVYSCRTDVIRGRHDMVWILSRTKKMESRRLNGLKALVASYGFNPLLMVNESQDCP